MVNKPLIRPYFWGGYVDQHDKAQFVNFVFLYIILFPFGYRDVHIITVVRVR